MAEPFGALCNDLCIEQRLNLRMDLPTGRETLMTLFDRLRKQFPRMDQFRRFNNELALESLASPGPVASQEWVSLRRTSVRSGAVNPATSKEAYALHKATLELAPVYLGVSALEVASLELTYCFDLLFAGNHDRLVFEALLAGSPLASLASARAVSVAECQPALAIALEQGEVEAFFHVKTRTPAAVRVAEAGGGGPGAGGGPGGDEPEVDPEPLSLTFTLRKLGPVDDVKSLPGILDRLARQGEKLLESRVIPNLIVPVRDAIASSNS
jgi:hypothetical protein